MGKFSPLIREDGEKKMRAGDEERQGWNLTEERNCELIICSPPGEDLPSRHDGVAWKSSQSSRLRRSPGCESVPPVSIGEPTAFAVDKQIQSRNFYARRLFCELWIICLQIRSFILMSRRIQTETSSLGGDFAIGKNLALFAALGFYQSLN